MFDAEDMADIEVNRPHIVEGEKYVKVSREEYIKQITRFLNRNTGITVEEMQAAMQTLLNHPSAKGRPSSNGRTAPFGGANRDSNSCGLTIKHKHDLETFLEVSSNEHLHPEYDRGYDEGDGYDWWKD